MSHVLDAGHDRHLAFGSLDIAASGKKAPKPLNDLGERKITLLIHFLGSDMDFSLKSNPVLCAS